MKPILAAAIAGTFLCATACQSPTPSPFPPASPTLGRIERLDPALDALIAPGKQIEVLGSGFDWAEGPVWLKREHALLFSDVPQNTVYRWTPGAGVHAFIKPSGYSGSIPRGGEPGSNGLTTDAQGRLLLCQHGDRQIARREKDGSFTALATGYEGKRFNSPNDLVVKSNGDVYFTDPPYGLEKNNADPKKELPFNGIYRVQPNGTVTLLTKDLTFPNGLAFSPDEKILYVAVSDPAHPVVMAYDVQADGLISNGRVFFNAKALVPGRKGLPDGMKVDRAGNVFTSGPGGILILTPTGKHLGTIFTGEATANCAFGDDGSTLYLTADMHLCRVPTKTKGCGF
jgi:gluconolactonase